MADWVGWHAPYDDPDSTQSRRLVVVRRRVGEALDALGAPARVLSPVSYTHLTLPTICSV